MGTFLPVRSRKMGHNLCITGIILGAIAEYKPLADYSPLRRLLELNQARAAQSPASAD
jgi:hypothetical protein